MNTAIVLLVVCAAAVQVHAGPHGDKWKKRVQECLESTGADPELIKAAKHGEPVTDENVKCFFTCLLKKSGLINEDGTINKNRLEQMAMHAPEEQQEAVKAEFAKCAEITGDNECDTGYRIGECLRPFMKRGRKQNRE